MATTTGATLRVVFNHLPQYTAATEAGLKTAVATNARRVQAAAQGRVPVRTGTLRRSITVQIAPNGLSARIGPSVEYGVYVEYGTSRMPARPYMRPAAELVKPQLVADVSAVLRKAA